MSDLFSYLVGLFSGAVVILLLLTPDYVNKIRAYDRIMKARILEDKQ